MAKEIENMGASVRARLLGISKESGQDYQLVLTRYANERLLYRLAESDHAGRFVLKGAMLLMTWFDEPFRGSRDVDLLGRGDPDPEVVLGLFKNVLARHANDGVLFDAKGANFGRIREDTDYGGLRIKTTADVGGARVPISIDVGFGDATEPQPEELTLTSLLDMPAAKLRGYARETVIAEKFQAMVALGLTNTRIKDYYDVWLLGQSFEFDEDHLARAIAATFERRGTDIPSETPVGLTPTFSEDEARLRQWDVFVRDVSVNPGSLHDVVETIAGVLMAAASIAGRSAATSIGGRLGQEEKRHMLSRGSVWHRWEPHIHAPGTVMNDQFTGPSAWDDYITALEAESPAIEVLAVTDYYVTETYQRVLEFKNAGRLPNVRLIFPNVELRLDVATTKSRFVNLHLFVSPEGEDHIDRLQRFLSRLQFTVQDDRYDCTRAELIRLGKTIDNSIVDDAAALAHGANQFKVNFRELRMVFEESAWARANILIAVAGGATDGTSGVRGTGAQAMRREIERFADVIFASSVAQREFWLGDRAMSVDQIRQIYRGLKPCLHGSDAHSNEDVATPFGDRFSWIKGGLEFDALRQACIDPRGRAYVGPEPPVTATPSQVISSVEIQGAPWLETPSIPLNEGLVAIIGARGSGKTALADMIAAGCDSIPDEDWTAVEDANPSFLVRARPLLGNGRVKINWAAGASETRALDGSDAGGLTSYPRVRYLSQQFVEVLCSSSGMADELLREIERVIFEAHPSEDRDGALDFQELLEQRANRHRLSREREAEAVAQISDRISTELEKVKLVAGLKAQVAQKEKLLAGYMTDRRNLVASGSEIRAERHNEVSQAADAIKVTVRRFNNQRRTFVALQDETKDVRRNQAPELLRQSQARHTNSGLSEEQWSAFMLDYTGPVDSNLEGYIKWADRKIEKLKGVAPPPPDDPKTPYFADDADLSKLPQAILEAEMARLEKLVSADKETQRNYTLLSQKIATENAALETLKQRFEDAKGANERARLLQTERERAYGRAFDALVAEQNVLEELYRPLMTRLAAESGTLRKLSFFVARTADVKAWADEAEEGLIDLRKVGDFKGRGTLSEKTNEVLKQPWETGGSEDVVTAMKKFRDRYQEGLLNQSPVAREEQEEFRAWLRRFAQWLFSTSHISIQYGIEYDGVDIRKLSPGTRGIVLLLLYLALDDGDGHPLVIDQPEENLDPKSVFEELVGLFVEAKSNRQVIMVTHNANLVINTDADQIIIAEAGPHPHDALPPITYVSGGLEDSKIRTMVCDILEGGEEAFQERARRLRLRLDR